MYLRFRNSQLYAPKSDGTFEELYRQIHGRLPEQVRPDNKPSFKVQIYLVRNQRINKKPTQIYIGCVANTKIYIDENKKIVLSDELRKTIREGLISYGVLLEKHKLLLKKVENYFDTLGVIH